MALKRGIEKAVAEVVAEIGKMSQPVSGDAIAQVGTVSANGDKTIGTIIAEAMDKVGKDGVITVEESKTMDTLLEVVEGMQFDRGYLSPYFVTDRRPYGSSPRRALHPDQRKEDLEHARSSADPRAGCEDGPSAAHHC